LSSNRRELIRGPFRGPVYAILLAGTLLSFNIGHAQISPGELSAPHQALDGISHCDRCHSGDGGSLADKCLDCHGEIKIQLTGRHGLHWNIVGEENHWRCATCHSEHNGRSYELVYWEKGVDSFNHDRTGFSLEAKHSTTKCRECHRREYIVSNLKALNPDIDLDKTFLGLGTRCVDCHRDVHLSQFKRPCTDCHGLESWRPAVGFSHDRSRYPLNGRHSRVDCVRCHRPYKPEVAGKSDVRTTRYTGLRFDDCSDCHAYRHRTVLGARCDACHNTGGWNLVKREAFDHRKTPFPLRGGHATTPCKSCHEGEDTKVALRYDRCSDCHEDAHPDGFRSKRYVGRCESCHTERGFKPSTYGLTEHDKGPYPLTGAHRAVPCNLCHKRKPGTKHVGFRVKSTECDGCHSDPHMRQFYKKAPYTGCESCHRTDRWTDLVFDHQKTPFPLDGRHAGVACGKCHTESRTKSGKAFTRYTPLARSCEGCHAGEPRYIIERGHQSSGETNRD